MIYTQIIKDALISNHYKEKLETIMICLVFYEKENKKKVLTYLIESLTESMKELNINEDPEKKDYCCELMNRLEEEYSLVNETEK